MRYLNSDLEKHKVCLILLSKQKKFTARLRVVLWLTFSLRYHEQRLQEYIENTGSFLLS